ncbi:MAG: MFS transporter, partial [Pirellulales bacterium]
TLAGTAFSYALWFVAGTFGLLVIARVVGGVMAGNVSTASAVVADRCEGPERAKGMGILGAAIGLGFVVGPAIGGVTSLWNLQAAWPGGSAYGINPFSVCAGASFLLAMVNLLWVVRRFPETRRTERDNTAATAPRRMFNPIGALLRIDQPGVRLADLAYFVYLTAFSAMEFTLTFLAVERLAYQPLDNMWMFVFVGITIAAVQGGVVRRLVPRLGERAVTTVGIGLTIPGFAVVGAAGSSVTLYLGLAFMSVGSALVMPSLTALVSRYTPADRQGLSLGIFRSLGALARAIGPILGGVAYWRLGSWSPYYLGAGLLLVPFGMSILLPPVAEQPEVAADP